jgi:hypothetical protein
MNKKNEQIVSKGEGHLFRAYLGHEWGNIHPNIQNRFSQDPAVDKAICYNGVMTQVRCSWLGKILAHSVQWTGALQPYRAVDVPVEIRVSAKAGIEGVFKERIYHFAGKKPFRFNSHMLMRNGKLLEFVGGGFGMQIHVDVKEGNLHFTDRGYFLQIGRVNIPLPYFLSPGDTYLLHENMEADTFRIVIRIRHRWFGEMYYQEGVFTHA